MPNETVYITEKEAVILAVFVQYENYMELSDLQIAKELEVLIKKLRS